MTVKILFLRWSAGITSTLLVLALGGCVIVHHDQKGKGLSAASANNGEFDSKGYVDTNWDAKIIPELTQNAADLPTVLAALKADPDAARVKYGRRQEESAPFTFIVRGQLKVKAANLESGAATLELATPAPTDDGAVLVQIGPVIKTSAVRDALSFVHFGDFTNQVDFANLSRALNTRVKETVVGTLDRPSLVGKTVKFTGAFAEDPGVVLITPVLLEVVK